MIILLGRVQSNGRKELCSTGTSDIHITPCLVSPGPDHTSHIPPDQTSSTDHLGREESAFFQGGRVARPACLNSPWALLFVFQFEGSINVLTQMMVDPATTERRGGAKNLPLRRGEILDVIQFTNEEQILCRNSQRMCESGGGWGSPTAGSTAQFWEEASSCKHPMTDLLTDLHLLDLTSALLP